MSFGGWFRRRGRISRRTWWLQYCLPFLGLYLLAGIADMAFGYPGPFGPGTPGTEYAVTGGPFEVWTSIAMAVPMISSTVARLHDRGLSARWLWWWFVPMIGFLVTFVPSALWAGHPGPNRYGPPPGVPGEPVAA